MNSKTILITGAAGFIGSYLSNYLTKYYNLILVDSLEFGGSRENLHENLRDQLTHYLKITVFSIYEKS